MAKLIKITYDPERKRVCLYPTGLNQMGMIACVKTHKEAEHLARELLLNAPDIIHTKHSANMSMFASSDYIQLCQERFPIDSPINTLSNFTDILHNQTTAINRCLTAFVDYHGTKSKKTIANLEQQFLLMEATIDHDYIAKFDSLTLNINTLATPMQTQLKYITTSLWQQFYHNYYYYAIEPNFCLIDKWAKFKSVLQSA